jgi:hypothetical protein
MSMKQARDGLNLQENAHERKAGGERRRYQKPLLSVYGRMSDLTHGPSLGNQESTNPGLFKL